MSIGGGLFLPFGVALAAQIRRIEGRSSPMAYLQLGGSTFLSTSTVIYVFMMFMLFFRPGRPPEVMLAFSGLAWLPFIGVWQPVRCQPSPSRSRYSAIGVHSKSESGRGGWVG